MRLTSIGTNTAESELTGGPRYAPSWVDHLTARVQNLAMPAWSFYLLIAAFFSLVRTLIGWLDKSYPVGTLFLTHALDGLTSLYLLMALHYIDDRAKSALETFRPVLNVDASLYEKLRYELTTMPARPVLLVGVLGLIFGLSYYPFLVSPDDLQNRHYLTSPVASIIDITISGIVWTFNSIFAYHTIHQLRLVSRIYSQHTHVSIFDRGPLYSLSRVGATTAVVLLALIYIYVALYGNWQLDTSIVNIAIGILFILIALATFVWPLFGAHRLLQLEKDRRKGEVARRIEATAVELESRTDAKDYDEMGKLNDTIDGLTKVQNIVSKASTWPWDPEALRAVVTALLLPVIIWIITRLLERFGI